ncbi:dUTP diphosphatase [Treponema sp. HNW]|uniref:dUTP diphosphatase n=1 Tax=Treponema sp. HNW TaxID=3116654 RepID=UPI003D11EA03
MSNTEENKKKSSAVCVKCLAPEGAVLPSYESAGAAGADIRAFLGEPLCIKSGCYAAVPTGLCFEIPEGYEIQVRPRSGLAAKKGVTVLNAPGTIDSDYRGEVKVILINHGKEDFTVSNGDRIAQLVLSPVLRGEFAAVRELSSTRRGAGGFGSTGV